MIVRRLPNTLESDRPSLKGMSAIPIIRIARPSDDIEALLTFYDRGLGLEVLGRFDDHAGFDGIILGKTGLPYHFEFTHAHGHSVGRAPTRDHLIVLYIPDLNEWRAAVERMRQAGFEPVPSFNPYWDRVGATFEDPDGYRVVLQRASWPN
jgi:catechol 2,3-dioxygenase-like lactoylglutathione lyase family enzyme